MSGLVARRAPHLLLLLCSLSAFAADSSLATVTGRVFDVYHRPVRSARVATMSRITEAGHTRIVAAMSAKVDDAGMYRLAVPPGRYILAVLPPPQPVDFATVFPAYFQDAVNFDKAQPLDLKAGEIRPFVDFLLLDVESHRLSGQVKGLNRQWGGAAVTLSKSAGFTDVLSVVQTDPLGRFEIDHVPAGSYILKAVAPVRVPNGVLRWPRDESIGVEVQVRQPEIQGIQIQLLSAAR